MNDARRVRGFPRESRRGFSIVHQRGAHHLDGALPIHLHVLAEIDPTHPAFADALQNVIAIRQHSVDERVSPFRPQCSAVAGTETRRRFVLRAAMCTELEHGDRLFVRQSRLSGQQPGSQPALGKGASLCIAQRALLPGQIGKRRNRVGVISFVGGHRHRVRTLPLGS